MRLNYKSGTSGGATMKPEMSAGSTIGDREAMRQWVKTWQRAGEELSVIRRREIEAADTQESIRQLFGSTDLYRDIPPRTTSGLVEQQAWFAKLRAKSSQ
jgi:hypothetical protein